MKCRYAPQMQPSGSSLPPYGNRQEMSPPSGGMQEYAAWQDKLNAQQRELEGLRNELVKLRAEEKSKEDIGDMHRQFRDNAQRETQVLSLQSALITAENAGVFVLLCTCICVSANVCVCACAKHLFEILCRPWSSDCARADTPIHPPTEGKSSKMMKISRAMFFWKEKWEKSRPKFFLICCI